MKTAIKLLGALLTLGLAIGLLSCDQEEENALLSPQGLSVADRTDCPACPDDYEFVNFDDQFTSTDVGTLVSTISTGAGDVNVFGVNPNYPGVNSAMILDTGTPPAGDPDLATPGYGPGNTTAQGLGLMISGNPNATPPLYDDFAFTSDPGQQGNIRIEFDFTPLGGNVTVNSVDFLDIDAFNTSPRVVLLDAGGVQIGPDYPATVFADNSFQTVCLDQTMGVAKVIAYLGGSGAVDNLCFQVPPPPPPGDDCTSTIGYWKTHSQYGPATPADPTWELLTDGPDTDFFGSGVSWIDLFNTPPAGGNAYVKLAHQYMGAKLNVLSGASTPSEVSDALATAEALLTAYADDLNIPNGPDKSAALGAHATLTDYNEGIIGPGHCDDNGDEEEEEEED